MAGSDSARACRSSSPISRVLLQPRLDLARSLRHAGDGQSFDQFRIHCGPARQCDRRFVASRAHTYPRPCSSHQRSAGSRRPPALRDPPAGRIMALRVALTISMTLATATLKPERLDHMIGIVDQTVDGSAQSDVAGRGVYAGSLVTSPLNRRARVRKRTLAAGGVGPVDVVLRRSGEPWSTGPRPAPCTANSSDSRAEVAARLAHRRTIHDNHALVRSRLLNGSSEVDHAHVVQHLGEEARTTDAGSRASRRRHVLIDGHPVTRLLRIERRVRTVWIQKRRK